MIQGNLLNVEEAAVVVGCTPGRIRQMLRKGTLPGVKANDRAWLITKRAAEKLAQQRPPKGRPPQK
ncbi:MAG: helix-turn-helix domain-containing protein [Pirellulaceae bacterium]